MLAMIYFSDNDMVIFDSHVWLFLIPVFKASSNCKKIQYEWITKQLANLSLYHTITSGLESPFAQRQSQSQYFLVDGNKTN